MTFYFQVLWKRKFLIILTAVITMAVVMVGITRMETVYTAQTMLRVIPFGIEKPDYGTYVYFDQLSNTFITIMESDTALDAAKLRLNLEKLPEWKMEKVPNTELLEISVTDQDPVLAQTVANVLADVLVEQIQSQYLTGVDAIEATLGTRIADLDVQIADLVQEQTRLEAAMPRDNVQIATVTSSITSLRDTRNGLLGSYSQALVSQTAQANTISIIDRAKAPTQPSGIKHAIILALGGVIGVVGGVVVAFVAQNLQPQLYNPKQIERITGFSVVGDLPPTPAKLRPDMFARKNEGAEVLRRLRARLLQNCDENALKTLLVTSSDCHKDSALVAANLAISLTYVFQHVLIIETHLRQPLLAQLWGLDTHCGLSHVLSAGAAVESAIQTGPRPNLDVMVAGESDSTAVDWIVSRHFAHMLNDLHRQYDAIVLHGAPLMLYADSMVLSEQASDILLVIHKNSVEKCVRMTGQELAPVASKMLGIVLT